MTHSKSNDSIAPTGEGAVADLVGGSADLVADHLALVDPAFLAPTGVATVVVHGDQDEQVPIEHSRSYVADAQAAGDDIELVELVGIEHFAIIDPASPAWASVLAAVAHVGHPA